MSCEPSVAVAIPAWGAQRFIAATVESVLRQSFEDFEVVIVDDASTDATVDVARATAGDDPRIRILVNEHNLGPAANWNRAISLTTAPYVKLLCSDDLLAPDCLALQVAALDATPSAGMVAARRDIIDAEGRVRFPARGLQGLHDFDRGHDAIRAAVRAATTPFGEPSVVLFRRTALVDAGPFSERYGTLVDLDLYSRLLRRWDCVSIDATLASFRMSPASWTDRSHGRQARNARLLLRDLAADPELCIGPILLGTGLMKTFVNDWGRRAAFAWSGLVTSRRS